MKLLANPLPAVPAGTRSAVLNTEARTVEADVLSRRCVMMRLVDFSYEQYQKALRQSAGAVVIILPRSISSVPQDVVKVKKKPHPTHFLSLLMGGVSERERGLGCCRAENSRCNTQQITFTFGNLSFPLWFVFPFFFLFSCTLSRC